jgi:serine/threonine-protein kinase RsbW
MTPAMQGPHGAGVLGIRAAAEVGRAVGAVAAAMAQEDYTDRDLFGLRLALEEALVNALRHGNRGDPSRRVAVRWRVTPDCVLVEVEDEGEGFVATRVPDALAPENLERPCGRGLLLMRHYLDEVRYHGRGNRVTLGKRRSPG